MHLPPHPTQHHPISVSSDSGCVSSVFQPPGGVPGTQPLLPNSMDPTRQQGKGGGCRQGGVACSTGAFFFPLLLTVHSSPIFSHRSPQHGRINAENEPSPRHGAHGSWPTGKLSICPSVSLPSVCTRLLSFFHSLSVSTFLAQLKEELIQVPGSPPGLQDAE